MMILAGLLPDSSVGFFFYASRGSPGPWRLECWIPQAEVSCGDNLQQTGEPEPSLPSMGAVGLAIGSTWQPDPYIAVMAVVEFDGALELRASRQRTTKNHVRDGNEHDLPSGKLT